MWRSRTNISDSVQLQSRSAFMRRVRTKKLRFSTPLYFYEALLKIAELGQSAAP